ncbi:MULTISPECIES: hypothetical protein [Streptomyces]|uniref:Uncharacterized protein n=1 Tax=Streptomyces yunnanensis TaxID=156453 RepID=A0A9X8MZ94_9ACTN|nr:MULTISPECIES: hypothetical protein [Streptomyces]SHM38581.1 hypothetical protein SAMN05216268_110259 [Streptomyces yunnanensis]
MSAGAWSWLDELAEEELAEMVRGLTACVDAVQGAGGDVVDLPEGTSTAEPATGDALPT